MHFGDDRSWFVPLDDEGNRPMDSFVDDSEALPTLGCHTGNAAGFNIVNPQPGYTYAWENNTEADRIRAKMRGGEFVQPGDQESSTLSRMAGLYGDGFGDGTTQRGLVLVRYSEDAVRQRREAEQAKAEAIRTGGAEEFLRGITNAEAEASGGEHTRFRHKSHSLTTYSDGGKNQISHWSPEDGIIPKG